MLPGRPEVPEPWLLGSSPQSAIWAAELGLPYAFADFINPNGAEIAALYQREFRAACGRGIRSRRSPCAAVAADSAEEAERLAASSRMAFAMLRKGRLIEVPHPDQATAFLQREGGGPARRMLLGTPDEVRAGIEAVASEYGAEEVIVVTITWDHEARRRSYELIAAEFG